MTSSNTQVETTLEMRDQPFPNKKDERNDAEGRMIFSLTIIVEIIFIN